MQDSRVVFFKVLLNRFHAGVRDTYLKNLPQEEVKDIFNQTLTASDPSIAFTWPAQLLFRTHYSWLAPVVRLMPHSIQGLLIASLEKKQAAGLTKLLNIPHPPNAKPSPAIRKFLLSKFYSLWNPQEALPLDFLPKTPLSPLLEFSKKNLVEVCDFLALYDLAEAIRHIVDKKYLKAIYLCLTPKKQQFLRFCLHKKEKITAPDLNMEKWDQQPETLASLLHQRGLLRLGKALCGQDSSFVWHIVHAFDTGRGGVISKYYLPEEIPGITPVLQQQLLSLINFLKQTSKA